jgi:hypothetical protein
MVSPAPVHFFMSAGAAAKGSSLAVMIVSYSPGSDIMTRQDLPM